MQLYFSRGERAQDVVLMLTWRTLARTRKVGGCVPPPRLLNLDAALFSRPEFLNLFANARVHLLMNNLGRQLVTASSRTSYTCARQRWCEASSSKRMLHTRRALEYPTENGVGSFLTPQGLQTLLEWQDGLLERLTEATKGTPNFSLCHITILI